MMSPTVMRPPDDALTSNSPRNPAPARSSRRSRRCFCINGFSEASIQVAEARGYSRITGFRALDSVSGIPGSISSMIWPTRTSWASLTVDQSRHTATASMDRSRNLATTSRTACSSRAMSTPPFRSDSFRDLEGVLPGHIRREITATEVEWAFLAALAVMQDVRKPLCRQECRSRLGPFDDGVGAPGSPVDEHSALADELHRDRCRAAVQHLRSHRECPDSSVPAW